jgi:SAM-dependent methyltransferase
MALALNTVRTMFDRWAPTYDADVLAGGWGFERYEVGHDWIRVHVSRGESPVRIVDLGCGTASIAEKLAESGMDFEYVGVDLSPVMLAIARRRPSVSRVIETDIHSLDAWTSTLTTHVRCVVISSYALHHVDDIEKASIIRKAFTAATRPDLEMLIVDYAFANRMERARALSEQADLGNFHVIDEISAEHYADLSELECALRPDGLSVSYANNGMWDWRIHIGVKKQYAQNLSRC